MIKQGTLVVRTKYTSFNRHLETSKIGYIFKVLKHCNYDSACYNNTSYINKNNYRLATEAEENYFNANPHITNINQIPESYTYSGTPNEVIKTEVKLNNFLVFINFCQSSLDKYKQLCNDYNINYDNSWVGSCKFYGIYDFNRVTARNTKPSNFTIYTIEEFENLLINNNKTQTNEVHRQNQEIYSRSINGEPRVSKLTKQIATGIRPTGNSTTIKIRTKKIGSITLSRSIISF